MRYSNFIYSIIILWVIFPLSIHAQKPMRVEFPKNSNSENYNIVSFEEQGLLVINPDESTKKSDSEVWVFTFLNNYLEKKWKLTKKLSRDLDFISEVTANNEKYLIFHNSKNRDEDRPSYLAKFSTDTTKIQWHEIHLPTKHVVVDFEIMNDVALIGVESRQQMPKLFLYNLKNKELKLIEDYHSAKGFIEDIKIDDGKYVVISRREPSRDINYLTYNTFSSDGKIRSAIKIDHPMDRLLFNNGQFFSISPTQKLVIGTFFKSRKGKTQNADELDVELSTGVFLALIEDRKLNTLKYHSFSDFDNFYNYLNSSNISILSKSMDKQKKKDTDFTAHFSLLLHDIIKTNDKLILAAETFYPEYRQERRVQYDYYGRMYPYYYSVFDGYRFNNALLAAFDLKGDLIWNNGMDMDEILSYDLYKRSHVAMDSNEVYLTYAHDGFLISKFIEENKVSKHEDRVNIQLDYATDILMDEGSIIFRNWYKNYYIIYGYQSIRNNNLKSKNRRSVFFINKIVLQ